MRQTGRRREDVSRRRLAAGLTQQQLADRAQVSVASIHDLEQGRVTRQRGDSTRRLAEALGLALQQRRSLARPKAILPAPRPPAEDSPARPANDPLPGRNSGSGLRIHVLGPGPAVSAGRGRQVPRAVLEEGLGSARINRLRAVDLTPRGHIPRFPLCIAGGTGYVDSHIERVGVNYQFKAATGTDSDAATAWNCRSPIARIGNRDTGQVTISVRDCHRHFPHNYMSTGVSARWPEFGRHC